MIRASLISPGGAAPLTIGQTTLNNLTYSPEGKYGKNKMKRVQKARRFPYARLSL